MKKGLLVFAAIGATLQGGAVLGATFNVTAAGMAFSPPAITIAVGDSVKWTVGPGLEFHTTTSGTGLLDPQAGVLWDAPLDPSSTTFIRRFSTAGVFQYFCRNHVDMGMKGTITVNTAPVARDTAVSTASNTPTPAQLQAFDADGNPLTFTMLSGPFHGIPGGFNTSSGSFTYTPAANYVGPDSIRFRVSDGFANSNTATMRITVTSNCNCPFQGDVTNDGFVDVFDVIREIDIAFSGGADITDPKCPTSRGDVSFDTFVDVFDVIRLVGIAFSGDVADNPCP